MTPLNKHVTTAPDRQAPMGTLPTYSDLISAIAEQARQLGPVFRLPAVRPTYVLSGHEALGIFRDVESVERSASLFPAEVLLSLSNDDTVPLSATNEAEHARRRAAWDGAAVLDRAGMSEAFPRLQRCMDATLKQWQEKGIFSLNLEARRACWRLGSLLVLSSERGDSSFKDADTLFSSAPLGERQAAKRRMTEWLDKEVNAIESPSLAARLHATEALSRAELINEINHGLMAGLFLGMPIATMLNTLGRDRERFAALRTESQALSHDLSLADIRRTPLLLKLIDEALRLTSPVPILFARAKIALRVDGVTIPAGATLLGAVHGTNQMSETMPTNDPNLVGAPASGLAFGLGVHACPAANQSTVVLWLFATKVLAGYDLRALDERDVPVRQAIGWQSPRGAYVQFGLASPDQAAHAQSSRPTKPHFPLTHTAQPHGLTQTPDHDARIAIVGAGITGLTLAHELRKRGYEHVTVFERGDSVGGKADTIIINGRPYNYGAHLCHGNLGVAALAAEVGVAMERTTSYVLWDIEQNRAVPRQYQDLAEFNKLRRWIASHPEIESPSGFAAAEPTLYPTVDRWLAANDLVALREIGPFFTGAGYGFMDEDVPAAFFLKFAQHMTEDGWTPSGGYKHLLERVSEGHDVRCSTEVVRIQRSPASKAGVRITTRAADAHGELAHELFDRVILTGPLEQADDYLDLNANESAMFSRIRSDDYYTVIATLNIEKPHAPGLYIVPQNTATRGEGGHTTAFVRAFDDSTVYHFFCYGEPDQSEEAVLERVRADARKLGGELAEVHVFRKWAYSPRVSPHDMALGYHAQLERMQGQSNTYYAGSLLAFELTDHNVLFAKSLVERCFPGEAQSNTTASTTESISVDPLSRLPETGTQSILDIVRERYEQTPNTLVSTFLDVKGKEVRALTYKTLVERAMACAVSLKDAKVQPGDRVALAYPPDTDEFLIGFFGCLFAQAIAVPIACPDPRKLEVDIPRFAHLMNDSGCNVALTTRLYYTAALVGRAWHRITKGGAQQAQWPKLTWIRTDGLSPLAPTARMPIPSPSAGTLAYLQYTSGSTSDPKGVMINHGNILHNVEAIRRQTNVTAQSVLVGWVPLFHDMGLVGGPLNAIYTGSHMVFFSPMSFLQNPRLWIEAMSQYRATHTESPNFGYEFLLRRLEGDALKDIDLSCVTHALFGGEAMRHRTFERVAERLHGTGFQPQAMTNIFGAAEATLFLAGGNDGRTPLLSVDTQALQSARRAVPQSPDSASTTTLIGCLIPPDGCDLRIVDPESTCLLPDREVGEIWLSSPSVAQGYWGRPTEDNDRTFRARVEGDPAPLRTYLRTGDLGFIDQGVLYICGRHKEMMIFQGRNLYPMDIEATVMNAHPAIRQGCVAAFSVEDGEQEGLVVVAEIKAAALAEAAAAASAIAVEVAAQHQLTCKAVVLVRSDALPKTSSGKLQRYRAREAYAAGQLQIILEQTPEHGALSHLLPEDAEVKQKAPDTTAFDGNEANSRHWLQRLVASSLQVDPDDVSTSISLFMFGIGSAQAMSMTARISQFVGRDLPSSALFEHPTIDELATYLCGNMPSGSRILVPLQRATTEHAPILFCVHPVGGSAMAYMGLVEQLPDALSVYAFDSDGSEVPCDDVIVMAQRYVSELQTVQKTGPYYLVGYSFGGTVAYEMARQMLTAGLDVGGLFMIDAPAPIYKETEAGPRTHEMSAYATFLETAMFNRIISDELDDEAREMLRQRVEANHKALASYRITRDKHVWPEITLYRADDEAQHLRDHLQHPAFDLPDFGWAQASPGSSVVVTKVPGDHFSVMNEPRKLATLLVRSIVQRI